MGPSHNQHAHGDPREMWWLLALVAFCYLDKILLGPYAFVDFYDTLEIHFAHFQNMFQLWREFGAFSWYPFHTGGLPSFVGQHPPYHPAVFLSGIMPIWLLSLLWNMGQMFLAGYGMSRTLRLLVNPAQPVRLFLAAAFALTWVSGNMHIVFSYAFPAFFAWTTDIARPDLPRRTRLGAALGLLLVSLFAFPVLSLPHFPVLHLAFVLFLGRELPYFRRQVAFVFAVWTGFVLLYAPSIVSLFLYIPYAQRDWGFRYPGLAAALVDLVRFCYGRLTDQHLLPLLLLSLGLFRQRKYQLLLAMFAGIMLISGLFTSDMKGLFANTFFAKMDLFLFASSLGVLGCIVAALALEHYRQSEAPLSWKAIGACALALTLFGSAHVVLRNVGLLAASLGLLALLRRHRPSEAGWLTRYGPVLIAVGLACMGMFVRQQYLIGGSSVPYARGFQAHPGLKRLAQDSTTKPFRVADVDVHPAVLQSLGLDTIGAKNPLFNKSYKQVVQEAVRPQLLSPALEAAFGGVWHQLYLTRNQGDHDQRPLALGSAEPRKASDFNLGLLLLMDVKYLVSPRPVLGMEAFAPPPVLEPGRSLGLKALDAVYGLPLYVYALNGQPGLGFLAHEVVLADTPQDVLRRLGAESAQELFRKAFLLRSDVTPEVLAALKPLALDAGAAKASPRPGASAGQVRLTHWSPDRLVFSGQADGPALLLVANSYDPRWTAKVNGAPVPLLRADHAFQAALVPQAGAFSAELTFSSPLVWQLHILSALGVLLIFSGAFARRDSRPHLLLPPPALHESWPVRCGIPKLLGFGLAAAAIWGVGFVLFILRRNPADDSLRYALATTPLIGLGVAAWTSRLLRKM